MKRIRKEKGISQQKLADELHVVRQTISKWEKGRSAPDADSVLKLAKLLDVSVNDLLDTPAETNEPVKKDDPSEEALAVTMDNVMNRLSALDATMQARERKRKRLIKIVSVILVGIVLFFALRFIAIMVWIGLNLA